MWRQFVTSAAKYTERWLHVTRLSLHYKRPPKQPSGSHTARASKKTKAKSQEPLEQTLWKAADKLRKNMDAAEYKHDRCALVAVFLDADLDLAHPTNYESLERP